MQTLLEVARAESRDCRPQRADTAAAPVRALTERFIAHRGLHGGSIPENSLAAFAAAADAGYSIECDVHVTSEGVPLVFHDRTLARMCHISETIERVTRAVLPSMRLHASEEHIPTLKEVLDVVAGRVPVFVDLQLPNTWARLRRPHWRATCEAVGADLVAYEGPVGIMAWDPRQLRWFAERMPHVLRIQSGGVVAELALLPGVASLFDDLRVARVSKPHAISYNAARLPRRSVGRARAAGRPVLAWTAHSAADLDRLVGHADNVIFEGFRPDAISPSLLSEAAGPSRLGRRLAELGSWWRSVGSLERAVITLALFVSLAFSVLFAGTSAAADRDLTAATVVTVAALAVWRPRRWVAFALAAGVWLELAALLPGRHLGLLELPAVLLASLTGAALRGVRLPHRT